MILTLTFRGHYGHSGIRRRDSCIGRFGFEQAFVRFSESTGSGRNTSQTVARESSRRRLRYTYGDRYLLISIFAYIGLTKEMYSG